MFLWRRTGCFFSSVVDPVVVVVYFHKPHEPHEGAWVAHVTLCANVRDVGDISCGKIGLSYRRLKIFCD